MITKPTVLVLGAGASNPYGYPTGRQLKKLIIDNVIIPQSRMGAILSYQAIRENQILAFRKALLRSGQASIDAFLEHQPQHTVLGKLAITVALAEIENIDRMFEIGDWYEHLFRALDTGFESFGENRLSIVTFNYDRSIETYLFNSLKYSYNKREESVAEILSKIPILHLHGQIGNLPWQDASTNRDYGETKDDYKIKQSSEGIKIIHEAEVEKSEVFIKAKELINNAEQIYFLGFGYHPDNIARLGIIDIGTEGRTVHGTCMGYTNREAEDTMIRCNRKIDLKQPGSQSFSILQFMRENIRFV